MRSFAFENRSTTVREMDKAIHVSEHEWEQRVLVHSLIPEYGEACLLCEDLSNNILQQMTNLKHDGLILVGYDGINSDLVIVQLSFCSVRRHLLKTHDANQRIVAQQGLFEVCRFYKSCKSIKELKEKRYIEIENSLYTIYKIRSEEKEKIKESLNHLGYNRIRLFPDLASACQYSNEVMREGFFIKST